VFVAIEKTINDAAFCRTKSVFQIGKRLPIFEVPNFANAQVSRYGPDQPLYQPGLNS
jgi:hypothetical protein